MSSSREHGRLSPPRVEEVSDGVYAYIQHDGSWWINNAGFLVGRGDVTAIDSCATEARTRALLAEIGRVSSGPVRLLVNTHHHGDHTHGNHLFGDATIVAHERCRDEILAAGVPGERQAAIWNGPEWGEVVLAPPTLTFRDSITLWVDDVRCEVRHLGTAAHTTNDAVIWLPDRSVLFSGDLLFSGGTPFLLMGSLAGALESVAALAEFGARTIVPGHGVVSGPDLIDEVLAYLKFVDDLARRGFEAGLSALDTAREADLGRFAELTDSERIVGNLHRAFAELRGAQRGAPIDIVAALTDMVIYNGGRRLTCLA